MRLSLDQKQERHRQRHDAHQSARTIASTPALIAFLDRSDVRALRFPSGWFHVFVGDRCFDGETLLAAVEAAQKAAQ